MVDLPGALRGGLAASGLVAVGVALGWTGVVSIEGEPPAQPAATAAVSADGQAPSSASADEPDSADVRPYRVMKDESVRAVTRGDWYDVGIYDVQAGRPVAHSMQVNLKIRSATGQRPTFVKVRWGRVPEARGPIDWTGTQVFAVPTSRGDKPYQLTHGHTFVAKSGRVTAQVLVPGRGQVELRLSVLKAITWPAT